MKKKVAVKQSKSVKKVVYGSAPLVVRGNALSVARVKSLRWFKVLKKRGSSWTGGHSHFNYSSYLPKNGKPGKPLPVLSNLVMCGKGWHVTAHPGDWGGTNPGNRIFEVQLIGKVLTETGESELGSGSQKVCCSSIQLVREIRAVPPPPPPPPDERMKILDRDFQRK